MLDSITVDDIAMDSNSSQDSSMRIRGKADQMGYKYDASENKSSVARLKDHPVVLLADIEMSFDDSDDEMTPNTFATSAVSTWQGNTVWLQDIALDLGDSDVDLADSHTPAAVNSSQHVTMDEINLELSDLETLLAIRTPGKAISTVIPGHIQANVTDL